jgi:MFS family permease
VAILLHQLVLSGMAAQQGAVLADLGLKGSAIGLFVALYGLSFAGGQAVLGWVMDRFDTPKVGVPFFAAGLVGILFFHYGIIEHRISSPPVLALTAILFGLGSGAELSLQGYYVTRYFGLRAAGELFATLLMVFVIAGAIGGLGFAACFDKTGSYGPALLIGEALLLVGIGLVALLKPYTFTVNGFAAAPARAKV